MHKIIDGRCMCGYEGTLWTDTDDWMICPKCFSKVIIRRKEHDARNN